MIVPLMRAGRVAYEKSRERTHIRDVVKVLILDCLCGTFEQFVEPIDSTRDAGPDGSGRDSVNSYT